ncbi:hypothetical protein E3Q17_02210 [Wallemia mellicola]|uniref:C2H2-type domain-containing protein n=1 Tax=Wallemia mellicola TaxID=1708541 RepID=A0A4T0NSM2_9BASI|nr:hypothetical protein E3Q17_02210 [Wallemia mellicola]
MGPYECSNCKYKFNFIDNLERHVARNRCGSSYDPSINLLNITEINLEVIDPPFKNMKVPTPEPRLRALPPRTTRVTRGNATQVEKQQIVDEVSNGRDKVFQCDCGKQYGYRESIYNHKKHGKCTGKPWGAAIIKCIPANPTVDDRKDAYKKRKVTDEEEADSKSTSSSPAPVIQPTSRQQRAAAAQATKTLSQEPQTSRTNLPTLPPLSSLEDHKPDVSMFVQNPMTVHPQPATIQYPNQPLYNSMAPPNVPGISSSASTPTSEVPPSIKKPITRIRQPEHEKAFACDCGKRFAYKTSIYHHKNRGGCPGRPWVTSEGGHRNRAKTGKHLSMMRAHELAQKMGEVGTLNVDFDNVPDHLKAEVANPIIVSKTKRKKSSISNGSESSSNAAGTSQDGSAGPSETPQPRPTIGLKIKEWKEPHPRQIGRPSLARQQLEQEIHQGNKHLISVHSPMVSSPTNQIPRPSNYSPSPHESSAPPIMHTTSQTNAPTAISTTPSNGQYNPLSMSRQNTQLVMQHEVNQTMQRHQHQHAPVTSQPLINNNHPFAQQNSQLMTPSNSNNPESTTPSHASLEFDDSIDSEAYAFGDIDDEGCISRTRWGPAGQALAENLAKRHELRKPASPTPFRPFVCLVPGCGRSYKNSNGLAAHFSSIRESGHGELGRKLRDEAKEKDHNPGFVGVFDSIMMDHPIPDEPEPED